MNVLEFSSLLFGTAIFAGLLGALTGLGGGVVIVPALVLLFKVDIRYAIGASLVSVIATSSGAAVAYVREGLSNIRIGMFLEVATTAGALLGAYLTTKLSSHWIAIVFGVVLLYSAYASFTKEPESSSASNPSALAAKLKLDGSYAGPLAQERYSAQNVPLGFGIMFGAGIPVSQQHLICWSAQFNYSSLRNENCPLVKPVQAFRCGREDSHSPGEGH
jgi:uncharacterized protein